MRKWYKKFKSHHQNIVDERCLGRPISATDKTLENKVDAIIQHDQKSRLSNIRGFGQWVRCVWRNKDLTPKGEDVKLITRWKHVPDMIG